VNSIISSFESEGAVNIFIKNDAVTLPSGAPVAKVYGTLDYPKKERKNEFVVLLVAICLPLIKGPLF